MYFNHEKKIIKRLYGNRKKTVDFNKIMFISCSKIDLNCYKLTYLIRHTFVSDDCISLLQHSIYLDFYQYQKIIKEPFGAWIDSSKLTFNNFNYYIYSNNGLLIYKSTKNDNFLRIGGFNSYGHKLLYKAIINNKLILEDSSTSFKGGIFYGKQ